MTQLTISYCFDLTRADAPTIEVGTLTVDNDRFVRFNWCTDWQALGLDPMILELFRSYPKYLPLLCNNEWPAYRDRAEPEWRKEHDPQNLVEFLCHTFRHSSLFVSAVSSDSP